MKNRGVSHLLLVMGALLLVAPPIAQGIQNRQTARLLQARNSAAAGLDSGERRPATDQSDPLEELRTEIRSRRGQSSAPPMSAEVEPPSAGAPTVVSADLPVVETGFRISLPTLGLDWIVRPTVGNDDLAHGPGHYPETAWPGEGGNLAIAGHRTHRGAPSYFYTLDQLKPGDTILIHRGNGTWTYRVERLFTTTAYDRSVLAATPEPVLTLTTCDPPGTEDLRLIVRARLVEKG
jgi:sortase A